MAGSEARLRASNSSVVTQAVHHDELDWSRETLSEDRSLLDNRRKAESRSHIDDESEVSSPTRKDKDKSRSTGHKGPGSSKRKTKVEVSSSRARATGRRSAKQRSNNSRQGSEGFFPRLSRILEDREHHQSRGRPKSSGSSKERGERMSRRSRTGEDVEISQRRHPRQKNSSLQRRVDALPPNPSLLSLLSSFTNASRYSSESNSTITQESYDRLMGIGAKRSRDPRKKIGQDTFEKRTVDSTLAMEKLEVHKYLDENASEVDASSPTSSTSRPSPSSVNHGFDRSLQRRTSQNGVVMGSSMAPDHSDYPDGWPHAGSGISVQGSSPESSQDKVRLHSLSRPEPSTGQGNDEMQLDVMQNSFSRSSNAATSNGYQPNDEHLKRRLRQQERELRDHVLQTSEHRRQHRHRREPSQSPHTTSSEYRTEQGVPPPIIHYPSHAVAGYPAASAVPPAHLQAHPYTGGLSSFREPDLTKTTIAGYELLATELCSERALQSGLKPAYRKFEGLNHRVLLHLQDEIAELEEELRMIDECIAQATGVDKDGRTPPFSRRVEARYGGELHYKRTDLLGRIFIKLGQYNQGLSAYSNMLKNFEPADATEIRAYKAWLDERSPLVEAETRFLQNEQDLLSVNLAETGLSAVRARRCASLGFPLLLLAPMMAFSVIPTYFGRVFIVIVVGMAQVAVVMSTHLFLWMTPNEWIVSAMMYFSVTVVVAGFV